MLTSFLVIAGTPRPYLKAALESLQRQNVSDWEAIIIEACADPEATVRVLEAVAAVADPRIRVVSYPGVRGFPPDASKKWNFGADHVSTESGLVAFLDDDDMKEDNWLEAMRAPFTDPNLATTLCNGQTIDGNGTRGGPLFGSPTLDYPTLLLGNFVTTGQILVRKRVFDAIGRFDETLGCAEDYEFALRLAGHPSHFVDETKCLKRDAVDNACYHIDVVPRTQVALRRTLTKHKVIGERCSRCNGPLEPDPGDAPGGWHWRVRLGGGKWNIYCGKDENCA